MISLVKVGANIDKIHKKFLSYMPIFVRRSEKTKSSPVGVKHTHTHMYTYINTYI